MEQDPETFIRQVREVVTENVSGEVEKMREKLQDEIEQMGGTLQEGLHGAMEGLLAALRDEVVDTIKNSTKASADSLDAISKRDADLYNRIDAALTHTGSGGGSASMTQDISDELHKLNEMFAILFGLAEKALSQAAESSGGGGSGNSAEIRDLANQISDLRRAVEARGGATGVAVTGDSSAVSRQLSDLSAQISRLGSGSSGANGTDLSRIREDISRGSVDVKDFIEAAKRELLAAVQEEATAREATPNGAGPDGRLVDAKVQAAVRDLQRELDTLRAENLQMKNQMERSRSQAESHWEKLREERQALEFQKQEFSKLRNQVMDEIERKRAEVGAVPRDLMSSALEREKQIVIETRKRLEAERQIVDHERKMLEERSRDFQNLEIEDEGRKQYNREVKRLMGDLIKQTDIAERNKIELESAMRTIETQNKQMALMKQKLAMQRDQLELELGRSSANLMNQSGHWDAQRSGLEKKLAKMGRRMNELRQENTRLRGETPKNSGSERGGTPLYGAYITTPGL